MNTIKALAVALPLLVIASCTTLTGGLDTNQAATATRVVIDADAAFIAGATALNVAEQTNPGLAAKAEPIRAQAYEALKALRLAEKAGRTPSADAFYALIAQLNTLAGAK